MNYCPECQKQWHYFHEDGDPCWWCPHCGKIEYELEPLEYELES